MTPVAEKIERTNARIGSKAIAHQAVEPVKAFAHIAAFYDIAAKTRFSLRFIGHFII
jgi:hypothetical protein